MAKKRTEAPGAHLSPADLHAIALLGFRRPTEKSGLDVIRKLREGLDYTAFTRVVRRMLLEEQEETAALQMLGYSMRTAQRVRASKRRIEPPYADRLYRLARVIARATEVFESEETAREWLFRPNRALGGETPFGLLDTELGADEIERILGRIEHNVFS